jgi:hypothetical protein
VHAGPDGTGPTIGLAQVTQSPQGLATWSFRGRALQALTTRQVSMHSHTAGLHAVLHGIPLTLR